MEGLNKPTVFVFTTAYFPLIGGAEIAVEEVCKRLNRDFRFVIFTARFRKDAPRREARPEGMVVRIGFGFSFDKVLLPFLGAVEALRLRRRERPQLFWGVQASWGSGALYLANIVYFWNRIPVILTLQEGDSETHIRRGRFGLIGLAWRSALARTDVLSAISNYLLDFGFRMGYLGPAEVIPNGVDAEVFERSRYAREALALREKFGFARDDVVVASVSRLVLKNGVDTLIRAFAEVRGRSPSVRAKLLVVGDGPERKNVEALVRKLDIADVAIFTGSIANENVPRYLAAADIFCRPSRSEGLGNSFLEAMAAGLPVVGTLVGGIPDFLKDGANGLGVRIDDIGDLADKLGRLARDPELRGRLGHQGRRTVRERYQWDAIAESYRGVFGREIRNEYIHVLIATSIFPPAIGGPAWYAQNLAILFHTRGVGVSVLTYGKRPREPSTEHVPVRWVSSALPSGLKHLVYAWRAYKLLGRADAVLLLDPFIAGVPATLAARARGKPTAVRVEGDFVWESYVERTGHEVTIAEFSRKHSEFGLSVKERIARAGSRWVFRLASVLVFSSEWRQRIFDSAFPNVNPRRVLILPPWPGRQEKMEQRGQSLIFAGRFLKIKNIQRLIRAFLKVAPASARLQLIGEGPEERWLAELIQKSRGSERITIEPALPHDMLLLRMSRARGLVLPSLSDVAPNVILDCIRTETPFLLTRETGLVEGLDGAGMLVDPLDEKDIEEKMKIFFDPIAYRAEQKRLADFRTVHVWDDIAKEWIAVIRSIL